MNKYIKKTAKFALGENKYNKLREYKIENKKKAKEKKLAREFKNTCMKNEKVFHDTFRRIMFECGISDNFDRTITPINIKNINGNGSDGIACELKFPEGLSIDEIDKCNTRLAQNVYGKCMVFIENQPNEPVRFSAIKSWHDVQYDLYENLNASQLFMGYTIDLRPVIIDMSKYPHLLITGGTGGGKSKLVEIIMTNLALNCTPEELELYYLQLSKDDNFKYELLEHCKGCVTSTSMDTKIETYQMALRMLKKIDEEQKRRGKLVKERLGRESEDINIHIYNKKFKEKLPVIQLWIDEAATLYKKDSNRELNQLIDQMKEITERIASAGRYVGIYLINVMQRASKDELPREIKINSMNWVSFNQKDAGASKVAIGDETSAVGLPQRVFAVVAGGENVKFAKTPFSKWDRSVKLIREKERIRVTSKAVLDEVYAAWNEEEVVVKQSKKVSSNLSTPPMQTQIVDKELNKLKDDYDKALHQISRLQFELDNKDEVIKELMYKVDADKKPKESDFIKHMNEMIYTTADEQKQEVSNLTNCSSYMELPKMPIKRVMKKGQK
jgi:hypothetical protein